jgi:large subunit ribosomal protein L3
MVIGVIGRKAGMTRIFTDEGQSIPVSVVEVEANLITQIKTDETDGYSAIQVTTGARQSSKVTKTAAGHFAKAGVEAGRGLWEFRVPSSELTGLEVGVELDISTLKVGDKVDVTGRSKGKGFAGVIKRWNFRMQDATHGNSLSHRAPGSIGQCQTPGRVVKGKKMAGQLGAARTTVQSLEIVKVDSDKNVILVKGAIPGAPGTDVVIKPAEKYR